MSVGPLQLAFYKGVTGKWGAVQFNPQRPHYYVEKNPKLKNFDGRYIKEEWRRTYQELSDADLKSREGAIFLEITSARDKNVYDWANKIIVALSVTDLAQVLEVLTGRKQDCKIMHDPGAKSASQGKVQKYLMVTSPKGIDHGVMITATEVAAGSNTPTKHTVPLSSHETLTLSEAIRGFIPVALGWA